MTHGVDAAPADRAGRAKDRRRNCPPIFRAGGAVQKVLYGKGWAARLAHRVGLQGKVGTQVHDVVLDGNGHRPPPLRIAFASDFHAGPVTHGKILDATCRALADARPDLLLLGGDYVSFRARDVDGLAARLGAIPAPLGRFAVLGNHDLWAGQWRVVRRLEDAGIRVLVNRNARLPAPFDRLWVCGLDDSGSGAPDPARAFEGADGARIVLMHSPEGLRVIGSMRFDLALCGHTHGGQIALPNGRPILVPPGRLCRRYPHRKFSVGADSGSTLIVSRGIGCSVLPVRLFADSEVLLCNVAWNGAHRTT